MYYTLIKHFGHLRTLEKCRKHSPVARVFYISLVLSNDHCVLSQCKTRLRLLYLLIKFKFQLVLMNCKPVSQIHYILSVKVSQQSKYFVRGKDSNGVENRTSTLLEHCVTGCVENSFVFRTFR